MAYYRLTIVTWCQKLMMAGLCIFWFSCMTAIADDLKAGAKEENSRITVAIMPFTAGVEAKESLHALSRGLSDMLITDLSNVQTIRLVERQRLQDIMKEISLAGKGYINPETAAKLGKGVGAKVILTGNFFSKGNVLRIDARLIHVETGEILVSEEITGLLDDPIELEKKLAQKLIDAIGVKLSKLEMADLSIKPTRNVDAIVAVGRAEISYDAGNLKTAKQEVANALKLDPDFKMAKTLAAAIDARLLALEKKTALIDAELSGVAEVRKNRVNSLSDQALIAKAAIEDTDPSVRLAAAKRLTDQALLTRIADKDMDAGVRRAAEEKRIELRLAEIEQLTDTSELGKIVAKDRSRIVRGAALQKSMDIQNDRIAKTTDQSKLAKEAINGNFMLMGDAIEKLTDQNLLAKVAIEANDNVVCIAAVTKLTDQNLLAKVAIENRDGLDIVGGMAVAALADKKLLKKVVAESTSEKTREAATDKLKELSDDKDASQK